MAGPVGDDGCVGYLLTSIRVANSSHDIAPTSALSTTPSTRTMIANRIVPPQVLVT